MLVAIVANQRSVCDSLCHTGDRRVHRQTDDSPAYLPPLDS